MTALFSEVDGVPPFFGAEFAGHRLRAPWPDEWPRLQRWLPAAFAAQPAHHRVLVGVEPERIVGALAVGMPASPAHAAALHLWVQPARRCTGLHVELLRAARGLARKVRVTGLQLTCAREAPEREFYLAHGATTAKIDQFHQGDLRVAHGRLHPMLARLPVGAESYAERPLQAADHPAVAAMVAAYGLLGVARARETLLREHDHELSLVCVRGEEVVGALLVKPTGPQTIYVEIRLVAPAQAARSGVINMRLITTACERWLEAGYTTFSLSAQIDKDQETLNFARRMRCELTAENHVLRWCC